MDKCDVDDKAPQNELEFLYLGDVWHALLGKAQAKLHPKIMCDSIHKGVPLYVTKDYSFFKYRPKGSLISCITVIKHEEALNLFYSEFLFLKGIENDLLFCGAKDQVDDGNDEAEGYVLLQTGEALEMWMYHPLYAEQRNTLRELTGSAPVKSKFYVAGLGWDIEKRSDTTFQIDDGPTYEAALQEFLQNHPDKSKEDFPYVEFDSSHLSCLIEKECLDAYEFASDILAVKEFRFYGMKIYCLEVKFLLTADDGEDSLSVNLYVSEHGLNGYAPKVGDNITGLMQLSAYMASEKAAELEKEDVADFEGEEDFQETWFQKLKGYFFK